MKYKWYVPFLFILPALLGLFAFRIGPILTAFVMAFTDWSAFGSPNFIGLENFVYPFEADSEFYEILKNTVLYSVIFVPGVMAAALGLALLINQKLKGVAFFRVLFFTPVITSTVAIGIWRSRRMSCRSGTQTTWKTGRRHRPTGRHPTGSSTRWAAGERTMSPMSAKWLSA